MNKSNFLKNAQSFLSEHSPKILMGLGIGGMVTTTALAVRATPKALELIEKAKKEERKDELTPGEVIKATWKCYIPAAIAGTTSIACLIGSCTVSSRRATALATAYKLSETALTEYREAALETVGEKKEKAIREKVSKNKMEKQPVTKSEVYITEKGETLFFDALTSRYFKSDIEHIKKSINELNRRMLLDMYVSLNEFYDEVGLEHSKVGDYIGWNIDDKFIEIDFNPHLGPNDTPAIALDFVVQPKWDYDKLR